MFITIEGIDGVGKSTQQALLAAWLRTQGHHVTVCRDPGSTRLGEKIREVLLHEVHLTEIKRRSEMLLYMAARAQLVDEVIQPALKAGHWVLSDRFLLSNVVYQGHAGGLNPDQLWLVGQVACAGIMPDLILLLDMDPEAALGRIQRPLDRMELKGLEFQQRLRQGFLTEAARQPQRIVVIDATQSQSAVTAALQRTVERFVP